MQTAEESYFLCKNPIYQFFFCFVHLTTKNSLAVFQWNSSNIYYWKLFQLVIRKVVPKPYQA